MYGKLDSSGIDTKKTTVVTVKYSSFSSDEKFEKEILKKISKNKLVIIVTHNPELAKEYSTRIIYSGL